MVANMTAKNKKITALITLLFFTTSSYACGFLTPLCLALFGAAEVGSGAAAAGAGEVAAAEFLATTGARYTMTQATTNSLAIHGGIAAITFGSAAALSSQTPTKSAPLQIILDPNKPLITPPNWRDATAGSPQPLPPLLDSSLYKYQNQTYPERFNTPQEACDQFKANYSSPYATMQTITYHSDTQQCFATTNNQSNPFAVETITKALSCANGYSLNQSQCTLQQPELVLKPSDNTCQLLTNGTSITPDSQDPDCKSPDLLAQGIDATDPSKLTITNPSKTDQHVARVYSEHKVELEHIYKDSSGNTVHDKIQIDPNPPTQSSPTVTGTSHTVNQGTGSLEQTTNTASTPTFDKSGLSTTANQVTQIAKQSETNTTLKSIESKIDCPECTVSDSSTTDKAKVDTEVKKTTDLLEKQGGDLQNQSDETLFTTGISAVIPSGGTCEPFTKTISRKSITIDPCPTMNLIQQTLGWLYALFGGYTVLGLIFRKPT